MRIAVVNWNDRKIGGAESYLAALLPALSRAGEELAFWCETQAPPERESVVPDGVPTTSVERTGRDAAFEALRRWRPDVLLVNGLTKPRNEAELQSVAPAVFWAHNYYGTCISGGKTLTKPVPVPCDRVLGPACLAYYYPRRCGGLNPLTMIDEYRVQTRRTELLKRYRALVCASTHMRREYERHGVAPERVFVAPYPVESLPGAEELPAPRAAPEADLPGRILFAGRLEAQKGGDLLLHSLPLVRARTGRRIELVIAGEGAERSELERAAERLSAADPGIAIRFVGWTSRPALGALMGWAHVLALPSVWPEPFGMIGPEAGRFGLPTASFAVGGIPDWLEDGVNGALAGGAIPSPEGFADALARCLDPREYPSLSEGARARSLRYTLGSHVDLLREVLRGAIEPSPVGSAR